MIGSSPESTMWSAVVQLALDDAKNNLRELDWFSTHHASRVMEYAGLEPDAVRDRVRIIAIAEARTRAAGGLNKFTEKAACLREGIVFNTVAIVDEKPKKRVQQKKAPVAG